MFHPRQLGPEMPQVFLKALPIQGLVQADSSCWDVQISIQHPLIPVTGDGHLQWPTFESQPGPRGLRLGNR